MSWGFSVVCKNKVEVKAAIDAQTRSGQREWGMPVAVADAFKATIDTLRDVRAEDGIAYMIEANGHVEAYGNNANFTCKISPVNTSNNKFYTGAQQ